MSFELRVEFAGICLYLIHPDTERVAVVMPDCRRNKVDVLEHLDKDPAAEPHAGYLRFDLACLGGVLPGVTPGGGTGAPPYEGIHRFDMQEVDFGLGAAGSIDTDDKHFVLPDFRRFAPDLEPRPDLFAANPGTPPLMRMVLRGGKMRGLGRRNWKVSKFPESSGDEHVGFFAGHVVWTRPVEGTDELPLTIRGFDKTGGVRIPLRPVTVEGKQVISLKVANLCCNPLEWEELTTRSDEGPDKDFKWLYRLLEPQSSTYDQLLDGGKELPHPIPPEENALGGEHCVGGKMTVAFTE